MSKKAKIIIILLVIALLVTYIAFNMYRADRPTVQPDESASRAIQVTGNEVTIRVDLCAPDLRRVDTFSQSSIIEVAGKEFDVCLINYGPAIHDRNLNQKLPNRCAIPTSRETVMFPVFRRGVDFSSIAEFCE